MDTDNEPTLAELTAAKLSGNTMTCLCCGRGWIVVYREELSDVSRRAF